MLLLKLILAILATIGALVVVGITVIVVLYLAVARRVTLRVRQSLQEFEDMQGLAFDADYIRSVDDLKEFDFDVPPMRIHLKKTLPAIWVNERDVETVSGVSKWIESNGFEFVGDYLISELPESRLKVFLSDDRWLVATIRQDNADDPIYVEFCFDLGDNQRGGVSNPPNATVPLPEDAVGEHFHERLEDGIQILPKMLARARELAEEYAALKADRNRIEKFFEVAHAAEMDLRIERGGLTAEEIRLALEHDKQTVSSADIEVIQRDWQDAIEQFLVVQSPRGADLIDDDGEVVAVHDGSLSTYLFARFHDFYESYGEIEPEEMSRLTGELDALLRLFKPREAIARFRPLLPESLRFSLIDQLRKPVEADLYLLPS